MEPRLALGRRRAARGFTLIELAVVVLILAVTVGLIGVNLGRSDADRVRDEADRLALLLQAARDRAILEGRVIVARFAPGGYRFLLVDDKGRLVPIEGDDDLRPRSLPEGMTLSLELGGAPAGGEAGLLFDPAGGLERFTLTVRLRDAAWETRNDDDRIRSLASGTAHAG